MYIHRASFPDNGDVVQYSLTQKRNKSGVTILDKFQQIFTLFQSKLFHKFCCNDKKCYYLV